MKVVEWFCGVEPSYPFQALAGGQARILRQKVHR